MKKLSPKASKLKLTKTKKDILKEPESKLDYFTKKLIRQKTLNREYQRSHSHRIARQRGAYAQVENILLGARGGKA